MFTGEKKRNKKKSLMILFQKYSNKRRKKKRVSKSLRKDNFAILTTFNYVK